MEFIGEASRGVQMSKLDTPFSSLTFDSSSSVSSM